MMDVEYHWVKFTNAHNNSLTWRLQHFCRPEGVEAVDRRLPILTCFRSPIYALTNTTKFDEKISVFKTKILVYPYESLKIYFIFIKNLMNKFLRWTLILLFGKENIDFSLTKKFFKNINQNEVQKNSR